MVILTVHNSYQYAGGEDEVFLQEAALMEQHGHHVIRSTAHNREIDGSNQLTLAKNTVFNASAYQRMRAMLRQHKPDIVHVHNTFPLLSPSVYYAAASEHVPVVQTLHNYRLLCPSAVLFREGQVCERCMTALWPWPAIQHGCYRGSKAASAVAATMLTAHRLLKTFRDKVTTYIAVSEFARSKFIQGGLPPGKICVKPNFLHPDPGIGSGSARYCIFVGRLAREKGVKTLLEAWENFNPAFDLVIAGEGEMDAEVAAAAKRTGRIQWLGKLQKPELYLQMKNAAALIVPSTWYEPFGNVVVEAFAMGLPVIASNIGALSTLVEHGRTGFHFEPSDAADLAIQLDRLASSNQANLSMRQEARAEFERLYTGERNYSLLLDIYEKTIRQYGHTTPAADNSDLAQLKDAESLIQISN